MVKFMVVDINSIGDDGETDLSRVLKITEEAKRHQALRDLMSQAPQWKVKR